MTVNMAATLANPAAASTGRRLTVIVPIVGFVRCRFACLFFSSRLYSRLEINFPPVSIRLEISSKAQQSSHSPMAVRQSRAPAVGARARIPTPREPAPAALPLLLAVVLLMFVHGA